MLVCAFDTETTDLFPNSLVNEKHMPRVIEFYGEIFDDQTGETVKELEFLCHPGHKLEAITTKITGLTDADLVGKQPFASHALEVIDLINAAEGATAHNLSYDRDVVEVELRRISKEGLLKWPSQMICTVEETVHFKGHRLKLSDLHEHLFGEPFEGAHRAKVDVKAQIRCYLELKRKGEI